MMKLHQYAEQFGISKEVLQTFIDAGLFDEDTVCIQNEVVQNLKTCACLHAMQCDMATMKTYIQLEQKKKNTTQPRIKILQKVRKEMLHTMHCANDVLDSISCVMEELIRNN